MRATCTRVAGANKETIYYNVWADILPPADGKLSNMFMTSQTITYA